MGILTPKTTEKTYIITITCLALRKTLVCCTVLYSTVYYGTRNYHSGDCDYGNEFPDPTQPGKKMSYAYISHYCTVY